ncbi:MAG: hypothetical protein FJ138_08800, partial [Deltaproteobacteria bacterium]|nr:hypothetical protein [Deltaproteobacteria bacterium]
EELHAAWFDDARVRALSLTLPPESLAALAVSPREWVEGALTDEDAGVTLARVGVRLKGQLGSARDLSQKAAFRVDLNRYERAQRHAGLKELTLNNMVQDPSAVREYATYLLFRELGLPAPRVTWVWLRLNGEDLGLYLSVEGYDDLALPRWFPSTAHLYEGAYGQDLSTWDVPALDVDEGDEEDRGDALGLAAFIESLPLEEVYARTARRVDWEQVAAFMAAEVWVGHWDGYAPTRNNYYLHFDDDGVLSLLPWGADQALAYPWAPYAGDALLFRACLLSAECEGRYWRALARAGEVAARLDLAGLLTARAAALRPYVEREPRREFGIEAHDAVVAEAAAFVRGRADALAPELACVLGSAPDADGDGVRCGRDCLPGDPRAYPGARDLCGDGVDQDCDGYADNAPDCPDCVPLTLAGRGWLVCTTPRAFADAEAHCRAQGARLAEPRTYDEAAALVSAALALRPQWWWWVGLSDQREEGAFEWLSGDPLDPALAALLWAPGEPNDAGGAEDCGHFFDAPLWNDIGCDAGLGVLCELQGP